MKNMRKLNRKGFTLVELLAVVVILALVMGIAASSMLSTMNTSRKSTLHSAAQTAATNLNNWIADDMLATTTSEQKLGDNFISYTQNEKKDDWICLGKDDKIATINNKGQTANLLSTLGLSDIDIIISTKKPKEKTATSYSLVTNYTGDNYSENTCSALRYNSSTGGYEVLLVARDGGKYYVASDNGKRDDAGNLIPMNYAFSRAESSNSTIAN